MCFECREPVPAPVSSAGPERNRTKMVKAEIQKCKRADYQTICKKIWFSPLNRNNGRQPLEPRAGSRTLHVSPPLGSRPHQSSSEKHRTHAKNVLRNLFSLDFQSTTPYWILSIIISPVTSLTQTFRQELSAVIRLKADWSVGLTFRSLHCDCSQSLMNPCGSRAKLNMNSLWVFRWLIVSMVSWIWRHEQSSPLDELIWTIQVSKSDRKVFGLSI